MARSTDPRKAARQSANLIRGISADPEIRARQVAKLQRRHVHGAQGGEKLERLRERHEAELAADYPQLDPRRRALLADRLGRIELASRFVAEHGIGPGTKVRRGEVWPITDKLEQWARAAEHLLAAAEAERAGGGHVESLDAYVKRAYGGEDAA